MISTSGRLRQSFATVNWIDVFIRNEYKEVLLDSLRFCQVKKDLELYAWCIMTSHVHLIIGSRGTPMEYIMRDFKTFTSTKLKQMIKENPVESIREWMVWMFGATNCPTSSFHYCKRKNFQEKAWFLSQYLDTTRRSIDLLLSGVPGVPAGHLTQQGHCR
ncbi:MAG TPA: transposase [Chitinophagales bacterium]|nr:transposase [Chitinophagales bacterium]